MSLSLLIEKLFIKLWTGPHLNYIWSSLVITKLTTEFVEFVGRNRIDVIELKSVFSHQHTHTNYIGLYLWMNLTFTS